jgi:hypothetical protein
MADEATIPEGVLTEQGGSLVVDLTGIQEAKFEQVPKGIYEFQVDSVEFKQSANSGGWMFEVWSHINGGDYDGRKLPMYLSFSAKALPFTKRTINLLAWPELQAAFDGAQIASSGILLNRTFRARVGQKEYEGEMRSNIATIVPANTPVANSGAAPASQFA